MKPSIKILSLFLIVGTAAYAADTASILPPAKTTFLDSNGNPLTSGTVDFYIPSTTTRKTTWQDAAEAIPNTNPVVLDAAGRALILGSGSYRQVVKDRNNNIIWDQVTSSTGSGSSPSAATGDGDLVGTIKPWAGMTAPNQYAFTYGQEISRSTFATLFTAITSSQATFCSTGSPIITGLADTTNFWIGTPVEVSCLATGNSTVISKTASTVTLAANANVTVNTTAVFFPWGRGNGTTTFNLPDFRGVPIAGNNNMGGVASSNLTVTYFGATNPNSIGALGGNETATLIATNLPAYTPAGTITSTLSSATGSTPVANLTSVGGATDTNFISLRNNANATAGSFNGTTVTGTVTSTFAGTATTGASVPFSIVQRTRTANYIIKTTPDVNSASASGVTSLGGMTGAIACGTNLTCTGNIISAILNTENQTFLNKAEVEATSISGTVQQITTISYFGGANLYGGGIYNRASSCVFSHVLFIQSLDGSCWELQPTNGNVYPVQAGAIVDGIVDNQDALDHVFTYANIKQVKIFFNVAGIYAHSGTWNIGNADCRAIDIDFIGVVNKSIAGNFVTIKHTGTGVNVSLDAGATSVCIGGNIGMTGQPLLTGNALTTYNLDIRSYHHAYWRIFSGDAATCGMRVRFTVESSIDFSSTINTRPVYGLKPVDALCFEDRGAGETATGNKIYTVIEGMTNGIRTNGLSFSTLTGTSEGNSGYGYFGQSALSNFNILFGFFAEGNGNFDYNFNGEYGSKLIVAAGNSLVAPSIQVNGANTTIEGGLFYDIIIAAGGTHTYLNGVAYRNTFTSIGGVGTGGTTWKDLYQFDTGTGIRTPIADNLSSYTYTVPQGGTGLIAGTSGGVPYFNSPTTMASSAALGAGLLVKGGGAGVAPSTFTLGGDCTFTTPNITCTKVNGVTFPSSITSGGILYAPSTSAIASSALLTANAIVLGGGAGVAPNVLGSLGTTTTVLHGNAAGAPTFSAVVSADLNITTTTCTNQFVSAISSGAVGTCATVSNSGLATMLTNTIKGNATSGTATPTDLPIGTCSTTASALIWTTNTGFGCNTAIVASSATSATNATNTAITNDTTTNAAMFPTWVTANTGNLPQNVTSTKFTFNPSTGNLSSTLFTGSGAGLTSVPNSALAITETPKGRLTLTTGTPVLTSTVTAGTTIFYTPYLGNITPIYDGTNTVPTAFAELSIALGSNWTTNTNYDTYVGSDSGTLRLCTGAAWTNSTTRSETLTRTNGILLNNASMTCRYNNTTTFTCAASRCTYMGTFRTTAAGQVDYIFGASASGGTAAVLNLWNQYNRVLTTTAVKDTGVAYTYASSTIRQARASAGNQITYLTGANEDAVQYNYNCGALLASNGAITCGVGVDTTSAYTVSPYGFQNIGTGTASVIGTSVGATQELLGSHFISANEASVVGTNTFDDGNLGGVNVLIAIIRN